MKFSLGHFGEWELTFPLHSEYNFNALDNSNKCLALNESNCILLYNPLCFWPTLKAILRVLHMPVNQCVCKSQ